MENTYDKKAGCRDCPPCYNLVLDALGVHRERLSELERLLKDILNNPTVLSDDAFEEKMATVINMVDSLWNDAKNAASSGGETTVEEHLDELKDKIKQVQDLLKQIGNSISHGTELSNIGESNITQAEDIIQRCSDALRDAEIYLDVQGTTALNTARDRSNQFGIQSARMSQIAREARQLADKQEDEAEHIEKIASEAETTSKKAYELYRKAQDDQLNITKVLKGLTDDIDDLTSQHNNTIELAKTSLDEARETKSEALSIHSAALSIGIPQVNSTIYKNEALDIKNEAQRIKEKVDKLMSDNEEFLENIDVQIEITEDLKNKGREQQQITAQLLSNVFTANKEADKAVKKADKTLEEAEETYQTLEQFDKTVQKSRGAAKEALNKVVEIEALIDDAEKLTQDAEFALKGAEKDAKGANETAQKAQKVAEEASKQAGNVKTEADETKVKAFDLKGEADLASSRVTSVDSKLLVFENKAAEHKILVEETQKKANQAKSQADLASKKTGEAVETVREILDILKRAPQLDASELASLEMRLKAARQSYDDSGIESSVKQLTEARKWQVKQILIYEEEIRRLKIEVENIREIKEALPDGCFSQAKLEP